MNGKEVSFKKGDLISIKPRFPWLQEEKEEVGIFWKVHRYHNFGKSNMKSNIAYMINQKRFINDVFSIFEKLK